MMHTHVERTINPLIPFQPLCQGTLEEFVNIGDTTRRVIIYIPEGARASTAGVFILPENGKTADDCYRDSWWRIIADTEERTEKMILFFLEPQDGTWDTAEAYGKPDGDVSYVEAVRLLGAQRYHFCVHESKFYLVGCREGGTLANMAAMWNPAVWAGLVSIGDSSVAPQYQLQAANDFCTDLHGFIDETHRFSIRKGEIGMPVWLIEEHAAAEDKHESALQYWKNSCGSQQKGMQTAPDTMTYQREEPFLKPNQDREAYRICTSVITAAAKDHGNLLLRRIWKDFLYPQRRWMSSPGGDLRVTKDPVVDLGMEYHYESIGGWMREWYVYVPERLKTHQELALPVVIAIHGYTCSGEIYAGNSGWHKVADQYGFIVIHPTATPGVVQAKTQASDPDFIPLPAWNFNRDAENGPDELLFFQTILEKTCMAYQVDRSRIYVTGHSHGSVMTQTLAMARSGWFAAAAPCSGVLFESFGMSILELPEIKNRQDIEVPIWMFGGSEEKWLMPTTPTDENDTGKSIQIWNKINHIDSSHPIQWDQNWSIHNTRWNDLTFHRGDGAPMVKYTWVDYMPHATMPEMSFRIWEEFFSKFSRECGTIIYRE